MCSSDLCGRKVDLVSGVCFTFGKVSKQIKDIAVQFLPMLGFQQNPIGIQQKAVIVSNIAAFGAPEGIL